MASSERWKKLERLLDQTLDLAPVERPAFLDRACGTDEALRAEVERLLQATERAGGFLGEPAPAYAAPLVAWIAAHRSPVPGARLGSYEIVRELGRGGIATVYLARDLEHDRSVALKVLHPELAAYLDTGRFLREIRSAASLNHPHILPVYASGAAAVPSGRVDSGEDELLWFSMPFVSGESLRQKLSRERRLPIDEAIRIAHQVGSALDYAHGRNLIHRGIKPENILLEGGHAVVSDFGIARALATAGRERLTEMGLAIGTPAYMSPEQAMGEEQLNSGSDLYSLGCVLYEMLTGEPPYTGATAQAIMAKRSSDPLPSARRLRDDVPTQLNAAICKLLATAPVDRFVSSAELIKSLASTGTSTSLPLGGRAGPGYRS